MVNITKIRSLAKEKGLKIGKICEKLGVNHTYLSNVEHGKNTMSEERVFDVAEILGTSFEYLMDMTDDPDPKFLMNLSLTTQEKLLAEVADRMNTMSEEHAETIKKLLDLPADKLDKVLEAVKMMIE